MDRSSPSPVTAQTVARIIWFAIACGASLFLAVVAFVRWSHPTSADPGLSVLVWVALGVALAGLATSRAVARSGAPADPGQARNRMVIQLALCEVGALLGGVAWLASGDARSLAAAALGLLGIALAFPRANAPALDGQRGPRRMVR